MREVRLGSGHLSWRYFVPLAPRVGTHVPRHQLVPGVRERSVHGFLVLGKHFHQLQVFGVFQNRVVHFGPLDEMHMVLRE